jgi:hypothetical protein
MVKPIYRFRDLNIRTLKKFRSQITTGKKSTKIGRQNYAYLSYLIAKKRKKK